MTTIATPSIPIPFSQRPIGTRSIADLVESLDGIPIKRIRFDPVPGTATIADCIKENEAGRSCELIDGILVEKAVSIPESYVSHLLSSLIGPYVLENDLGMCNAPDGMFEMAQRNIRKPDFSFTRNERVVVPLPTVADWCPDLCVEVISESNTRGEMARKRKEYFQAGCQLVWEIDPRTRTVDVYTTADNPRETLEENGMLSGMHVLPGFHLSLKTLFKHLGKFFPVKGK